MRAPGSGMGVGRLSGISKANVWLSSWPKTMEGNATGTNEMRPPSSVPLRLTDHFHSKVDVFAGEWTCGPIILMRANCLRLS